jgi:hypothetical protein
MEPHVDIDVAYTKTALGRSFLEQPPVAGNRGRRSLLIMMDGQRTLHSLLPIIRTLGLSLEDVQAMVIQGLLEPVRPRPARTQSAPARTPAAARDAGTGEAAPEVSPEKAPARPRATTGAAAPATARAAAPATPPRQPLPGPRPVPAGKPATAAGRPTPGQGLGSVKSALAELLSRVLGRTESRLHERLTAVENAPGLAEWLDECLMYLAAVQGSTAVMRFRMEVAALLPLAAQRPGTLADLVPGRVAPRRESRDAPATGPGALLEDG